MSHDDHAEQTAVYQITVQGYLETDWSVYLNGLTIAPNQSTAQTTSTLTGSLRDQAALLGVLNNLYNLGFPILSIEQKVFDNKENNYV